jgi:hypothetical protein
MSFVCEFCSASFTTKSNLSTHQKRTKKCLLLQNKNVSNEFECIKCHKVFTSNYSLEKHIEKCNVEIYTEYNLLRLQNEKLMLTISSLKQESKQKDKRIKDLELSKNNEIVELKQQIEKLQSRLGDIAEIGAKKATTNYRVNNIVNQLIPYDLSQEKIKMIVNEKFTENHLYAKENGIANFAVHNLLTDDEGYKMTCTDMARKLFIYKDEKGNIYKDPNASSFLQTYIPAVKKKSYEIISDKDGDDMIELSECITSMDESIVTLKLANKLIPKPN